MTTTRLEQYNDLLVTPAKAQKDKKSFYSDHVPEMSEMPAGSAKLNVVTWNAFVPNLSSGFDTRESPAEAKDRKIRSMDKLVELIAEQKPDAILIQESHFDQKELLEKLSAVKWKISAKDSKTSTITLYNPEKLEELSSKEEPIVVDGYQPISMQQSLFKIKSAVADVEQKKEEQVMILNAHLPHYDEAHKAEAYITESLRRAQEKIWKCHHGRRL